VKCTHCGGRLEKSTNRCPYCQTFQEVDLKQIAFADLGVANPAMPCPACDGTLRHIRIDLQPPLTIERCGTCCGLFFNPGELEHVLDAQTNPVVVIDYQQIDVLASDVSPQSAIRYRKCPVCAERMSPWNFGGRSGVILDRCGAHGFWLDGGELRRLAEWWRVGGKHLHQQHEAVRVRRLNAPLTTPERPTSPLPEPRSSGWDVFDALDLVDVARLIASVVNFWK
jgi:Zn-finger nucleic acid-binding protein